MVLKSANPTPATAHALVSIIHEAGAPAGVMNMVLGRGIIGDALSKHPDVNGISFTGSQTVGSKVAMAAVSHQARVQMEMGGKNPLVVMDDAEFDRAVQIAVDGGYFATGQRCTASSRVFVQEGIYDKFIAAVAERAKALKVGNALDPSTQMGPAVTDTQLAGNLKYVDIALKEGGRLLAGGADALKLGTPGHYMSPTLIVDTKPGDTINQEEVFGPVVSVVKIKTYEEGLALCNAGNFGLSAGIVTTSLKHARHFQRNVKAGMVMINLPTAGGRTTHLPFGGTPLAFGLMVRLQESRALPRWTSSRRSRRLILSPNEGPALLHLGGTREPPFFHGRPSRSGLASRLGARSAAAWCRAKGPLDLSHFPGSPFSFGGCGRYARLHQGHNDGERSWLCGRFY